MADTFYIKRGDTLFDLVYSLKAPAGMDLSGGAVRFKMRTSVGNVVVVLNKPAIIDQPVNPPIVRYVWDTADTATAGTFLGEFEVTLADGKIKTFPDPGFLVVQVSEDIQ